MRIRARLLPILWLSAISLSALAGGCWDDDPGPDDGGDAGKGGKGGAAGCDKAGTGGTGGSRTCSRAGSGGVGGTPGPAGNGPWPSLGQPINGTCGVPPEPRWGFELYEDASRIAVPTRGGKDIDVMGMLSEVGEGAPDDLGRDGGDEESLRYARIESSSHTYTIVTYGVPNFGDALSTGTQVSFAHHDDTCANVLCGPGNIVTSLRSGDSLAVLHARSPNEPAHPDGFSVKLGEELCEGRSHCIAWTGHTVEVTNPGDNVTLEFSPGTANELGDYTIHAGIVRDYKEKNNLESDHGECGDSASNATVELLFFHTFPQ